MSLDKFIASTFFRVCQKSSTSYSLLFEARNIPCSSHWPSHILSLTRRLFMPQTRATLFLLPVNSLGATTAHEIERRKKTMTRTTTKTNKK